MTGASDPERRGGVGRAAGVSGGVVGIVVVSHSRALARAAVALARQMPVTAGVPIAVAAGLDEENPGTDAARIAEALGEADAGAGVVVLMDLGSAVLSAQLALDLVEDDDARRVLLCPAPLVEGLVAAAVAAGSGARRDRVAAEAVASLDGKVAQLGGRSRPEPPPVPEPAGATGRFTVTTEHGLHARPAARLIQLVQGGRARVELRNLSTGTPWVPAGSMTALMTLGALPGHEVEVRASGPEARVAVDGVITLAREAFGDPPPATDAAGDGSPTT